MFSQVLANALLAAAFIAITAVGFTLIYSATRFFHFTHGIVFTLGAYFALALRSPLDLSLGAAIPTAVVLCALTGYLIELFVYRPLRRRRATGLVLLLASIGVYVVLQNSLSLAFGDDTKTIRPDVLAQPIGFLGASLTGLQLLSIAVAVFVIGMVDLFRRCTRSGKCLRALSCDPELADVVGVRTTRVIALTFILGSGLAGTAGILHALDMDMTPTMGMPVLMLAIVAAIIGGVRNAWATAGGALLLSLAQQLGTWVVGGEWRDAIAFLVLISFLMARRRGIGGAASPRTDI